MSLFGAKSTFQKAKDRLDKKMREEAEAKGSTPGKSTATEESSHIGWQLEFLGRGLPDPDGTATTSEIAREREEQLVKQPEAVTLLREVFNQAVRIHNKEVRESGHPSQVIEPVWGPAKRDKYGWPLGGEVHTISSDDGSSLSPLPTTSYGGSEISFPSQTPREAIPPMSTSYEGNIVAMPPSTLPDDPFSTPRASAGIIARRYTQAEENVSQSEEKEVGMEEAQKVYTPILRNFEISDSEDDRMSEVEWREEEPYVTPTKSGKKWNKGKGVERPQTPERPIPNMPQTPRRRRLKADWAKPAEEAANGKGPGNLEEFIGEYLRNTNGLREFMLGKEKYDTIYADWCEKQAGHVAARQNHTDAEVMDIRKKAEKLLTEVELSRAYDEDRVDKLDQRLEKIKRKLAKLAPVNMTKRIENALSGWKEKMIDQLMDSVVERIQDMAEKDRKREAIRRGKQVEATPEEHGMSDIEFHAAATCSQEENEKVERILRNMSLEVDEQELDQSKHAPGISPGWVRGEFRKLAAGEITILKKKPVVPAVPQQKKKEAKKPEAVEVPKGPKAGGKKPEVKKPEGKKP
jgi:hypothetical protein